MTTPQIPGLARSIFDEDPELAFLTYLMRYGRGRSGGPMMPPGFDTGSGPMMPPGVDTGSGPPSSGAGSYQPIGGETPDPRRFNPGYQLRPPGGGNSPPGAIGGRHPSMGQFQRPLTMPQERFLKGKYSDVYDQYRQGLGGELAAGRTPTQSFFGDFLPNFDLNKFRLGFSPQQRGLGMNRFMPRTQFLYR